MSSIVQKTAVQLASNYFSFKI